MRHQLSTLQERSSKALEEANNRHTEAMVAANERIEQLCNKNAGKCYVILPLRMPFLYMVGD